MSTTQETKVEQEAVKRDFYHLIINGEKVKSSTGETIKTYNPATGELVAEVAKASKEDTEKAVAAAREAFDNGKWKKYPVGRRAQVLNKIAAIMRSRFNELVELEVLDTGKTIHAAQGQITQAIEDFEFYAGAIVGHRGTVNNVPGQFHNYTEKEPVGVCAQITPWNYPMMMAAWKIAPAIAVGCSVIVKPASLTPLTTIVLGEICQEAGVPAGVVNIVPGSGAEVGDYLVGHPQVDKVAFTGSTPIGKDIMSKASQTLKRVTLELGGKSPNLVFADADIDAAVDGSLFGIFYNSGQSCEARSRLYVHEDIYDEFVSKFVEKAKKIKLGDPLDKGTHMGAIIDQGQLDTIDSYVQSAIQDGAEVLAGGKQVHPEGYENGFWYEPTVIANVNHDMKVVQEEIFGPVVVVMKFKDEKEAIRLANDTDFGLGSAIWTKDGARATRVANQIQAGIVMINCPFSAFPGTPFGGYKQSGFGRELSIESLDLYTETKSILSYYGSRPINPLGV
ncbi:aldehyde dehydrogenase family protein [Pseudobacillus badius]|uniref:aldehyde dehydrogenase family protein n=1 Tax=Bacillus badius TaxID=1455 RepID=UPI0007B053A9|nr:aldehyde dehydrogenase family protein [Bacillus badius]KZO00128.1 betaine-aldehyde dehydrogenase [Bacillus badius]MED0665451.1 aldehyde dehydrogenase family protein [Bacillus badius]OCS86290.1 betaine-aldehyde dehydrogenase [Bacillus badius]OVE52250.1 betaine-aldehyde dehydrogenase [Bacillus badius]TDW03969.1 aldehyde dehydrogenase (NAD+) [Bacillus badius]